MIGLQPECCKTAHVKARPLVFLSRLPSLLKFWSYILVSWLFASGTERPHGIRSHTGKGLCWFIYCERSFSLRLARSHSSSFFRRRLLIQTFCSADCGWTADELKVCQTGLDSQDEGWAAYQSLVGMISKSCLTQSKYLCSIFLPFLHLSVFAKLNERMEKQSHFSKASQCVSGSSSHEIFSFFFFIEHRFGISWLCFVLISKLLQRIQMLRMFSPFARSEFSWLTMFCSDAWLVKLYSNSQSTQIYYIVHENWICWL